MKTHFCCSELPSLWSFLTEAPGNSHSTHPCPPGLHPIKGILGSQEKEDAHLGFQAPSRLAKPTPHPHLPPHLSVLQASFCSLVFLCSLPPLSLKRGLGDRERDGTLRLSSPGDCIQPGCQGNLEENLAPLLTNFSRTFHVFSVSEFQPRALHSKRFTCNAGLIWIF